MRWTSKNIYYIIYIKRIGMSIHAHAGGGKEKPPVKTSIHLLSKEVVMAKGSCPQK
jgi:hypothetical protein